MIDPHPDLFLAIIASFYRYKEGRIEFWKKMVALLEHSLKSAQLEQH